MIDRLASLGGSLISLGVKVVDLITSRQRSQKEELDAAVASKPPEALDELEKRRDAERRARLRGE